MASCAQIQEILQGIYPGGELSVSFIRQSYSVFQSSRTHVQSYSKVGLPQILIWDLTVSDTVFGNLVA